MIIRRQLLTLACIFQLALGGCAQKHELSDSANVEEKGDLSVSSRARAVAPNVRQNEQAAEEKQSIAEDQGFEEPQTLGEARLQFESHYRLKPDRQFLWAISDVYRFFGQDLKVEPADATFQDGHWIVRCAGQDVGTLSEIPSSEELYGLLVKWAERTAKASNMHLSPSKPTDASNVLARGGLFAPIDLFVVLRRCDERWRHGEHTQGVINQATDALVLLSFQQLDLMQVSDRLTARALSMVAICNALTGQKSLRNQCLMMDNLGDRAGAKTLSLALPANDPVRLYLEGRIADLERLADSDPGNEQTAYFLAKLLSTTGQKETWTKRVAKQSSPPAMTLSLIKTYEPIADKRSLIPVGNLIMAETLAEIERDHNPEHALTSDQLQWSDELSKESLNWMMSNVLAEFQNSMKTAKKSEPVQSKQSFYDGDIFESYYFGNFCSGVYLLAKAFFSLAIEQTLCDDFARSLHVDSNGPCKEVELWFKDRMGTRTHSIGYSKLQSDLLSWQSLGAPAPLAVVNDLGSYNLSEDAARLIWLSRRLFMLLDSRDSNRRTIARFLQSTLLDAKAAHKLVLSAKLNGESADLTPDWSVRHIEDGSFVAAFTKQLDSSNISDERKLQLLEYLQWQCFFNPATDKKLHSRLETEYASLIAREPHNWNYMKKYALFFLQFKEFDAWTKALNAWLAKQPKNSADEQEARLSLAQACYRVGRYSEGLKALGKFAAAEDPDPDCIMLKAQLLNGMGKKTDAEAWVSETLHQFPTKSDLLFPAAEIYWRNGHYEEAARILRGDYVTPSDWEVFSSIFVQVFSDSPDNAVQAVAALKSGGLDRHVGTLAAKAFFLGKPQLAFAIESQDVNSGDRARLVNSYRYLKYWKGEEEALKWLRGKVPQERRSQFAYNAFDLLQNELLWKFIPEKLGPGNDSVWVLRAAASVNDHTLTPGQRDLLKQHFLAGTDFNSQLGRYLLDLPQANAVFSEKLNSRQICAAAFYIGWKGCRKGSNYYEDSSWLRLAVETGQDRSFEYNQAWSWLETIQTEVGHQGLGSKAISHVHIDDLPVVKALSTRFNGVCVIHID